MIVSAPAAPKAALRASKSELARGGTDGVRDWQVSDRMPNFNPQDVSKRPTPNFISASPDREKRRGPTCHPTQSRAWNEG